MRITVTCVLCGKALFWDHPFKEHNLRAHEEACERLMSRAYRKRVAKGVAKSKRKGAAAGSVIVPAIGQRGLPIEGIPEEIVE